MEERREMLLKFAQIVKQILGENLRKIIVYGSYARGDYNENSDIDIMILTTLSNRELELAENKIFDVAFDFEMEYGVVINPVLENEGHFKYWLGALPFFDNVAKDGIEID